MDTVPPGATELGDAVARLEYAEGTGVDVATGVLVEVGAPPPSATGLA